MIKSYLLNKFALSEELSNSNTNSAVINISNANICAIKIIPLVCLTVFAISELYIRVFIGFDIISFCYSVVSSIYFIGVLILNSFQKYHISRVAIVVYIFLAMIGMHFMLDYGTGAASIFLASFLFFIFLFDSQKVVMLYSMVVVGIYLTSIYFQGLPEYKPLVEYKDEEIVVLRGFFIICSSILMLITAFYLKNDLLERNKDSTDLVS